MGFHSDNEIGNKGENAIFNFLSIYPSTTAIIDVTKDAWFQQFDIDFIQQDIFHNINKIEVKTDRLADKTGNMVYEIWSDKRVHSKGCFEKTEADYIFYYLINTRILYIFKTIDLRAWVRLHASSLKYTDMGDNAFGYVISLNDLKDISTKIKI